MKVKKNYNKNWIYNVLVVWLRSRHCSLLDRFFSLMKKSCSIMKCSCGGINWSSPTIAMFFECAGLTGSHHLRESDRRIKRLFEQGAEDQTCPPLSCDWSIFTRTDSETTVVEDWECELVSSYPSCLYPIIPYEMVHWLIEFSGSVHTFFAQTDSFMHSAHVIILDITKAYVRSH